MDAIYRDKYKVMQIVDALPPNIRHVINYAPVGFDNAEIQTVAEQYAAGRVTEKTIIEQMIRVVNRRINTNNRR